MHDEVSETENIRKNLAIERMIVEGCEVLLDTSQTFVRQGKQDQSVNTDFYIRLLTLYCQKIHQRTLRVNTVKGKVPSKPMWTEA